MLKYFWYLWIILHLHWNSFAQTSTEKTTVKQSITLSFQEAKARMLKENLSLLAAYYDISIAEADLISAKLWTNPYFIWNQDLYSVERNEYLNFNNQKLVQVEQVFSISGKYVNRVKLAKLGVEQNKLALQEAIRGLMMDLGERFLTLNALQQKAALYQSTLSRYDELIKSAEEKLRVGAMSSNEVVRLRSELIAVKAEATHNQNDILAEMSALRILLNLPEDVNIETVDKNPNTNVVVELGKLINDAMENRPDYKLAINQIDYSKQDLKLQKAMSVPDIKLAYQPHDRGSNYVRPYQGVNLEMPLPLFDRNQGNIKMAKAKISQAELNFQLAENTLRNEVQESYAQMLNSKAGFEEFSEDFLKRIEELNTNSTYNYVKKNINLLEFIDLQRIYIQNKLQYIDLKNEYQRAINKLNFMVGKEVFE
ncbi:MAG: TolC family protein [Flammeovirgaceae bacterium]